MSKTNETIETILKRYSCRSYQETPVADEDLETLANVALTSPTGNGLQPWRIVVVKDHSLIAELNEEGMKILKEKLPDAYDRFASSGGLFYGAPNMIVIPIDTRQDEGLSKMDCAIVSDHIAIAATSLGVANVICGIAGFCFSGDKKEYFEKKLGFPEGFAFGIAVLLGYEKEAGRPHDPDPAKIIVI
jgi:nitroreductase